MLKHIVEYTDFDDTKQRDELWFHLSKTSLMLSEQKVYDEIMVLSQELKKMLPSLEEIGKNIESENSDDPLTSGNRIVVDAARLMAQMLDKIVSLSYGIRSEDRKRFIRTPEVVAEFKSSMAYEAFVINLLEEPDKLLKFIESLTAQIKS